MGVMKNTEEEAILAIRWMRAVGQWASVSDLRGLFVVLLVMLAFLGTQYFYVGYLLAEVDRHHDSQNRERTALGQEIQYQLTLDALTLCLDSAKAEPKLHAWYCKDAVALYKKSSEMRLPARTSEVVDKLAYGAMKNDVSHHLRSVGLDRLLHAPPTKEAERLKLLLSKPALGLWIFVVSLATLAVYVSLRSRRNANPLPKIDVSFQSE